MLHRDGGTVASIRQQRWNEIQGKSDAIVGTYIVSLEKKNETKFVSFPKYKFYSYNKDDSILSKRLLDDAFLGCCNCVSGHSPLL